MLFTGGIRRGRFIAMAFLAWTLFASAGGSAKEVEVGDLMNRMKGAYTELVKSLLLFPVEESGDEAPLGVMIKHLGEIARTARELPKLENYKNDKSFGTFARNLEAQALRLLSVVKKKRQKDSVSGLAILQDACLQCHNKHRF